MKKLLLTASLNPVAKNKKGKTPMELLPPLDDNQTEIFLLFAPFEQCRMDCPVESYSKVFICGNTTAGKSSLGWSMRIRADNEPDHDYGDETVVGRVEPLTAGIRSYNVDSKELGRVVLYDFAGHPEYYSSHEAVLENIMLHSSAVFIVVTDLTKEMKEIEKELLYWFNFIENVCGKLPKSVHVIVAGSRADEIQKKNLADHRIQKKSLADHKIQKKSLDDLRIMHEDLICSIRSSSSYPKTSYKGFMPLDCHKPGGVGVKEFMSLLSRCCQTVVEQSESVDFYCYVHYSFLRTIKKVSITISELCEKLREKNSPSLPFEIDRVEKYLKSLSDRGLIVWLRNRQEPEKSYVVIQKEKLLEEVIGTLFSTTAILRVHREIASNTGIVSVATLKREFPDYDAKMLVGFLINLQFCRRIDPQVQTTIDNTREADDSKELLLFPSLISAKCDQEVHIDAKYGWCLYCGDKNRFLSTRFIQVLLLSLAFKHCLKKDPDLGEVRRSTTATLYQRRCKIWKTGIYWKKDGVAVLVEITDHNRCVTLLLSEKDGVGVSFLCSSIIRMIREYQSKFCRCTSSEYIIDPHSLSNVRDVALHMRVIFPIKEVAKAVFLNRVRVDDIKHEKSEEPGTLLGEDEPYRTINVDIINLLFEFEPDHHLPFNIHKALSLCSSAMKDHMCNTVKAAIKRIHEYTIFPEGNPLVSVGLIVVHIIIVHVAPGWYLW